MTIRNLQYLLDAESVAIIGATERSGSVGAAVTRNVLEGGFRGAIRLINPKHGRLQGQACYPDVASLDMVPQLAVVCTPPASVPGLIAELGAKGCKAAIVVTAGFGGSTDGRERTRAMLDAAKPNLLRILGPNCVGLLSPHIGLNASFAHQSALPGKLAFVSQSGALTTALLDWAHSRGIGFSHFVSLGDSADIDFGDVLDYLASDPRTEAILLYVEAIKHARKFMSAARAAARNKPIIVVKAGRAPEGARAAATHTGALTGSDAVYDAAFRRAGALRVFTTSDLFVAAETLASAKPVAGERVAILTNGGGPGVLAADALSLGGAQLATLSPLSMTSLDHLLPPNWSHANPVDIIGDAPVARYVESLKILAADAQIDALLFIHAPTAIAGSSAIALACAPLLRALTVPVYACCLGGNAVARARQVFTEAGIPSFETPEQAASAFLQGMQYRRNQELLFETPPAETDVSVPETATARSIVDNALMEDRAMLSEPEAKAILRAYGIAVAQTRIAPDIDAALAAAEQLGYPVALKILSPDITHKSDVGGVVLDIQTPERLREAAATMLAGVRSLLPLAALHGFAVQTMIRRPHARELIVGVSTDLVFGPVILFGQGGTATEKIADTALALPPLNTYLARDLMARTSVSKQLDAHRNRPAADRKAIEFVLLRISQLVADLSEVIELDINPLLADEHGVIALDARMRIAPALQKGSDRFAIRPYPLHLEERVQVCGRQVTVRPIRPEDESEFKTFLSRTAAADPYFRFFHLSRELPHSQLARFTQIDYDREMALVALSSGDLVAEARARAEPDNRRAELCVLVRPDWVGTDIDRVLLSRLVSYCRQRGTAQLFGDVFPENDRLLEVTATLGFHRLPGPGKTIRIALDL